jgi:hypothetical protein
MTIDFMTKLEELQQRSSAVEQCPHKALVGSPNLPVATKSTWLLDGVILSDGSLCRSRNSSPYFSIAQGKGNLHLDWIRKIQGYLQSYHIELCKDYPKIRGSNQELFLISRANYMIDYQYSRWYKNKIKVVPNDIVLSPLVLADWFMGDGSVYQRESGNRYLTLATHGFSRDEVEYLKALLDEVYLKGFSVNHQTNMSSTNGYYLGTGISSLIDDFLNRVDSFVVPSFEYKMKRVAGPNPVPAII